MKTHNLGAGLASNTTCLYKMWRRIHLYSSHKKTYSYEVNTRFVYGLRSTGKDHGAAKTLCVIMELAKPQTKFRTFNKDICPIRK